MIETLKDIVKRIELDMQCNCDLDNWQPERSTGHSWVCRIHKKAKMLEEMKEEMKNGR